MTIRNLIKKEEACGAEHTAEKWKGLKKLRHPKRWLALLLVIVLAEIVAAQSLIKSCDFLVFSHNLRSFLQF